MTQLLIAIGALWGIAVTCLLFAGWIWLLIAAFRTDPVWGTLCLLLCFPCAIIFILLHLKEFKTLAVYLLGVFFFAMLFATYCGLFLQNL